MPKYLMSKAVGIDLGTTNSAVAVMKPADTEIVIHSDAITKRETTPSCVWKDPRTGQIVVGRKAFSRVGTNPVPIRSIKRSMGKQAKVLLTKEQVTPEQVSSYILSDMKRQIEEDVVGFATQTAEWVVDRAIVTVPAYFDQPQIEATRKAAEMAGLQVLELLHEPTAAACYYCWQNGVQNGVFMVYDFGGGTFDVSILRCTEGAFEVLGIGGNNRLGGDDIDAALAEELQNRLLQEGYALKLDIKNNPEDSLRFDKLKLLAEGVKKALSTASEFVLRDAIALQDKEGTMVDIDMMLERQEAETIMRPIVERTISYCFNALELAKQKAGVKLSDIDAIILAGGTTHIPLVREVVRAAFCAEPSTQDMRAKCTEPVYKKVDTIVALGAAIRAAAIGGLAIYNPERTVRVSFRGIGATSSKQTHIGGKVEALVPTIDLTGGSIRLTIDDIGFEDEQQLKGGTFGFTRVPLQPSAENLLTFEVYNRKGTRIATVERSISQSKEALRPTGGSTGTANSPKAYYLEVSKAGKAARKELIESMATLPATKDFTFYHPGNTELLRLPLYQNKKKIQEIKVSVPAKLPKGTPISLTIHIDELSGITVRGKIKSVNTEFDAMLELPPERGVPSNSDFQSLDQAFQQAVAYVPADHQSQMEAQYRQAREGYELALKRGDPDHAVHEFEEMEELVANCTRDDGTLQPPKEFFDKLVNECKDLEGLLAQVGQTHKAREIARAIEAQRTQGEQAYTDADATAYADVVVNLNGIRDHLIMLLRQLINYEDTRSEREKAAARVGFALEDADEVELLAKSARRPDIQNEIALIRKMLSVATHDIDREPMEVQQKASQARTRLEQIRNMLIGLLGQSPDGKLVVSDE